MLNEDLRSKLLLAAKKARRRAYAPYSEFRVGAAVLTDDNKIFSGCNIENGSFGATICAERVAVFKAVSENHPKIRAVAVVAESPDPIPPCGMCLQVLSEFGQNAEVIMANTAGNYKISSVTKLLPKAFEFKRKS